MPTGEWSIGFYGTIVTAVLITTDLLQGAARAIFPLLSPPKLPRRRGSCVVARRGTAILISRMLSADSSSSLLQVDGGAGVFPFAAWRSQASRGSCGVTREGDEGDCKRGTRGSFGWPGRSSRLVDAVGACLRVCSQCSQCRYISVSARFSDCSWYSSCRLSQLRSTADTKTFLSGPAAPAWNTSSFSKKGARWDSRPNNTACPASVATEARRAIGAWDPSKVLPSRPTAARVAVMQGSDGQTAKPTQKSFGGHSATDVATWRRRAPPCYGGHLAFLAAATNRAFARRHGYDYVEARGDCMRQLGRHPSWCKMVMVKGLRAPHSNPLSNRLHGNPGWEVSREVATLLSLPLARSGSLGRLSV